eukprot:1190697-Prorocentrum_minimum.AAC.9
MRQWARRGQSRRSFWLVGAVVFRSTSGKLAAYLLEYDFVLFLVHLVHGAYLAKFPYLRRSQPYQHPFRQKTTRRGPLGMVLTGSRGYRICESPSATLQLSQLPTLLGRLWWALGFRVRFSNALFV